MGPPGTRTNTNPMGFFRMWFDPPILTDLVIMLGLAKVSQGFVKIPGLVLCPGMLHPIPNLPFLSPRQDTGRRYRACVLTQFYQCHQKLALELRCPNSEVGLFNIPGSTSAKGRPILSSTPAF